MTTQRSRVLHAVLTFVIVCLAGAAPAPVFAQSDTPPVLNLVQPLNYTIGQPDIPIKGACIDDAPGCMVTVNGVETGPPFLGTSFETVIKPPDGEPILTFRATDSTGQTVEVTRQVYVSSRGGLSVAETFQGKILDIDAARARPTAV